jgi:hypothetical protein
MFWLLCVVFLGGCESPGKQGLVMSLWVAAIPLVRGVGISLAAENPGGCWVGNIPPGVHRELRERGNIVTPLQKS